MRTVIAIVCVVVSQLIAASPTRAMSPTSAPSRDARAVRAVQRPRVVVFFERGFPAADTVAPDGEILRAALAAFDVMLADARELPAALDDERSTVLVLPFGSAFPQSAWPAINRYLGRGGSFVNLGGVPFAQPVAGEPGAWRLLRRTTTYHKQLGIVQAFPVDGSGLVYRDAPGLEYRGDEVLAREALPRRIYELVVRLTSVKAFPDEDGSDGPREARLDPVVYAYRGGGTGSTGAAPLPVAAPFVRIDRLRGSYAGGRWVLATGDGPVSPAGVTWLVGLALRGPQSLRVQPRFAGFHPGEPITATVVYERPGRMLSADGGSCILTVTDSTGAEVARSVESLPIDLPDAGWRASAEVSIPLKSAELRRGRYTIAAEVEGFKAVSGFWVYDAAMLRGGRALKPAREYFVRDGVPFPVAGTTYMATDVHRRFLLEPNPAAWASDFARMAAAGVNTIRTGIWTGWRLHASGDGTPTEAMLRALEVFVLTAREHGMPVIFNLFAFVPPTWEAGRVNPYFAPAARAAQRRFAGGVAARLAGADDIIWDLINEPSFSSPDRLWSCRPNYDADEQAAWEAWIRETAPSAQKKTTIEAAVLDRWNGLPEEGLALPRLEDFGDKNLFGTTRPNKAADYKRFAQAAFAGWVRELSAAIRANGNLSQLVTVGQDEGGATERPNPLLFGDAVDFVGTHTWWNNDALLWDTLVSKRPDRPSLVGETGLMTYERPDGHAWRNEVEAHNLLERKLALAFAAGGAGFVQWLWNTNVYMPIDNEAGIGLLRADGTAKPEFDAFARLAGFLARHRQLFHDRSPEDVVVVVPQSQLFSVRDFATAATQRAVWALEYELRAPVRVLSELAADELKKGARLIVVPSPRTLTEAAWRALLAAADAGAAVLVTGPIDRDEYERPVDRLAALGIRAETRPVAAVNALTVGKVQVSVPFRGSKLERLERGVIVVADPATAGRADAGGGRLLTVARGKGRLIWCPLPIELADADAAILTVYGEALTAAQLPVHPAAGPAGVLVRPLIFPDATLFVVVNESDSDATVALRASGDGSRPVPSVRIAADRAVLVLVDRRTGQIVDSSR